MVKSPALAAAGGTLLTVILLTTACGRAGVSGPAALDVAGRSNAHLSLAADGDRVAASWAASAQDGTDIYAAMSSDGGRTFSAPVRVNDHPGDANPGGEQPPRIVVKGSSVDVVWVSKRESVSGIRVASSTDGGATFGPTRTITPPNVTGARGWESAAMDDSGVLHAAWLDGRNNGPHEHMSGPPVRQDIYHAVWGADGTAVETMVASNVCFCCKTALVSRGDEVYVAWRHLFPGGVRDIAVARSSDRGKTFSAPVRVSLDNWKIDACPDDGPAMTLDARGALDITWPTMVKDRVGIFEASSTDGGATFTPRVRIDSGTAAASHPRIAASASAVAIVWDELANGARRAWVRVGTAAPIALNAEGAASYPAVAATKNGFIAGWTEQQGETSVLRTRVIPAS
jgi:hypothetical protein